MLLLWQLLLYYCIIVLDISKWAVHDCISVRYDGSSLIELS